MTEMIVLFRITVTVKESVQDLQNNVQLLAILALSSFAALEVFAYPFLNLELPSAMLMVTHALHLITVSEDNALQDNVLFVKHLMCALHMDATGPLVCVRHLTLQCLVTIITLAPSLTDVLLDNAGETSPK